MGVAVNIDKALINNVKNVLNLVGRQINQILHTDGMPNSLHNGIDTVFEAMWPEVQKDILDSFLLGKGLSFRLCESSAPQIAHAPPPPRRAVIAAA
eukprot:7089666-Prymnesium_polylepis.1